MSCDGKGKKLVDDFKYVRENGKMVYKNITSAIACEKCHQKGRTACMECNGTGKKQCEKCHGSGTNACDNCLGKGHVVRQWKLM